MAGTITHFYFAKEIGSRLKEKRNITLDQDLLYIFAQSMDPFHFYSLFLPFKKEGIKKRGFSEIFHTQKTDDFFKELILYIKNKNLYEDIYVRTFLYGLITHYVLDSSLHPYVEYKCGCFNSKDKNTYKYNAKHHEMETFLDTYMLKCDGKISKSYKSYKILFNTDNINSNLIKTMDFVFKKVYGIDNFSKDYIKAIKDMKYSFRIFRYDPTGIKLFAYKIFDIISTKKVLNSVFLSYNFKVKDEEHFLNNEKRTWVYPADKKMVLNYSFDEIYHNALNKCIEIICKVDDYFTFEKIINYKELFSLSYLYGIDWRIKVYKTIHEF